MGWLTMELQIKTQVVNTRLRKEKHNSLFITLFQCMHRLCHPEGWWTEKKKTQKTYNPPYSPPQQPNPGKYFGLYMIDAGCIKLE